MKSEVTLLLVCTLFSKVLSLTCQHCAPLSGTCEETICPHQCVTLTTSVYMMCADKNGDKLQEFTMKSCSEADQCVSGNMNLGAVKLGVNSKCCGTDLCNAETLPALPRLDPNGRKCYTCNANGCSGIVDCEGNEDHCVALSVKQKNKTMTMKGCVSKSYCIGPGSTSEAGLSISDVQCCEGELCNAAESFTLSFLLMIVPLLSSMLF